VGDIELRLSFPSEAVFALTAFALAVSAMFLLGMRPTRLVSRLALGIASLGGLLPVALLGRLDEMDTSRRALWEWSAVGGPVMQAAYHADALAGVGATAAVLVCGAGAVIAAREERRLLAALLIMNGLAVLTLTTTTDLVFSVIVASVVASLTAAAAIVAGPAPAAARLTALLAFGVQAFVGVALVVNRFGINTFDLDQIPAAAISPGALVATAIGAALFCGLYPFVPWRYERQPPRQRALTTLRGALAFPAGVAGTVLTLRVLEATGAPVHALLLPQVDLEARAVAGAAVFAIGLITFWRGGKGAWPRLATAFILIGFLALYPLLRWAHLVALAAIFTVAYASLASTAIPEEWSVARFDARLGTLWAAIALGTPVALLGGFLATVASGVAFGLEAAPLPPRWISHARAAARTLVCAGPFIALVGLIGAPDPGLAAIAGAALAWAGAIELGHAIRAARDEGWLPFNERLFGALASYAAFLLLGIVAGPALARSAVALGHADGLAWPPYAAPAMAAGVAVLAAAVTFLPDLVAIRLPGGAESALRRALATADPVPGAVLTYRLIEVASARIASAFAFIEERSGVWLAALLIAAALFWARAE
jgi:hypothetical protein